MARLVGINHVVLEVDDVDEALAFYGRVFEFELRGRVPGMAFLDMGDQFLALAEGREQPPDPERHFGLVVDDKQAALRALEAAGADIVAGRGLNVRDPWCNRIEIVEYADVQFTKAPAVAAAMGIEGLEKSEDARREMREKGLL